MRAVPIWTKIRSGAERNRRTGGFVRSQGGGVFSCLLPAGPWCLGRASGFDVWELWRCSVMKD
jgi:hypothetical protein